MTPLGDKIINEIIRQSMIQAEDDGDSVLMIWSGNAAEQLEAVVDRHYRPVIHALELFCSSKNASERKKAQAAAKEALESL